MEKMRELEQRIRVWRKTAGLIALCLIIGGITPIIYLMGESEAYSGMVSDEHMTDPNIAYSDFENSTYTYDQNWFLEKMENYRILVVLCFVIVLIGYVMLLVTSGLISQKELHKKCCAVDYSTEYCPDCGILMSKVRK